QENLSKYLNSEVATLSKINRLIVSNSLKNAHISMLQPTMHWLEKIQAYDSIDQEVDALVSNLDERENFILLHRFGVDTNLTLEEIGDRYKITRERVRQIQAKIQKKLVARATRIPLFYSQAAILVLRRLGEDTSLELWQKKLTDINILKEGSSLRLLVAIGRATGVSKLALPEEFSQWLKQRVSAHILAVSKSVLDKARKLHRNCGAVRARSLVTERVSESDVEQILRLNGFAEEYPGWWAKDGGESVPERVATKVIACCGPVSASEMRYALSKHLSRFQLPAPPSEVIAKVLEKRGEFILNDGLLSRRRPLLVRVNLTGPERLFLKDMKTEGPILSFEIIHFSLVEAGFSTASVTSLLKYSPLVRKIKTPFYTMLGTKYDIADIERVESQLTRVSAKPTIRPRSDGVIEFETNVGSWLAYGGVIASGPATRMKGAWAIMYNGTIQGELIVEGNFIRGLSSVCKTLDVMPGDRIRIEFDTWKREARIGKVVSNEKVS
ncbi:sigma factor-like helix-turn-helix DNA-binding protein, partial [Chloroflexota bacterium]